MMPANKLPALLFCISLWSLPRPKKTIHFKIKMYGRKGQGTTINWAL
jgi:hypothetical protein